MIGDLHQVYDGVNGTRIPAPREKGKPCSIPDENPEELDPTLTFPRPAAIHLRKRGEGERKCPWPARPP